MDLEIFFNQDPTNTPPTDEPIIETPPFSGDDDPILDPTPTDDSDDTDDVDDAGDKDTDDNADDADDPADGGDPTVKAYFDFLEEYGIIQTPEDFKFDGSPEKLKEALDLTKQSLTQQVAANLWSALPENFRPLLEYGLRGGSSLEEYLEAYSEIDYSTLDLEDVNTQRRVMADYYRQTTSHSPEKINRFITRLEESGDLRDEASEVLSELSVIQERKKAELMNKVEKERMQQAQRQKEKVDSLVNAIESSSAIHPSRRSKLRAFFFSPVKLEDGNATTGFNYTIDAIMQNPEHQAQLADLLLEYDPKKGFSLERFEKRVASKAAKSFQETLTEKLDSPIKTSASKTTPQSSSKFDWNSFYNN